MPVKKPVKKSIRERIARGRLLGALKKMRKLDVPEMQIRKAKKELKPGESRKIEGHYRIATVNRDKSGGISITLHRTDRLVINQSQLDAEAYSRPRVKPRKKVGRLRKRVEKFASKKKQ